MLKMYFTDTWIKMSNVLVQSYALMESTCNLTFDFRKKRSEKAINTVNVLINTPGALHFPKGGGYY